MLRILILLIPVIAFGKLVEDREQYFRQIFAPEGLQDDMEGCNQGVGDDDISDFPLRLTNLRNTKNSSSVSELPNLMGKYEMGGIFNNANEVDSNFSADWGHNGAESNKISQNEMGSCIYCSTAYGYDAGFDFIQDQVFSFHKKVNGTDIQVNQPKIVDFERIGAGYDRKKIIFSEDPYIRNGKGELRLFIPFMGGIDYIMLGDQRVRVPVLGGRSSNFADSDHPTIDRRVTAKKPGLCIVFHPVSTNTPHDVNLSAGTTQMVGDPMSSLRNKKVQDYNTLHNTHCPMPDWGYQGFYESYEDICLKNVAPRVNPGCRCKGGYDDIVCYNSESVYQMDCKNKSDGQRPDVIKSEFKCDEYEFTMKGETANCCSKDEGYYSRQDIGYACSWAVKNQDFTSHEISNWSTSPVKRFTITRDATKEE